METITADRIMLSIKITATFRLLRARSRVAIHTNVKLMSERDFSPTIPYPAFQQAVELWLRPTLATPLIFVVTPSRDLCEFS
jgi:hypothetical protein